MIVEDIITINFLLFRDLFFKIIKSAILFIIHSDYTQNPIINRLRYQQKLISTKYTLHIFKLI